MIYFTIITALWTYQSKTKQDYGDSRILKQSRAIMLLHIARLYRPNSSEVRLSLGRSSYLSIIE